jgi:GAF domain-containing protein
VLYSQTRTTLEHLQDVQQRYVHQAWREFLTTTPVVTADYTQPGTKPGDQKFLREARRAAMVHKRTVATSSPPPGDDGNSAALQAALVVPLKLRGQVIGTVALHETAQQRPWTAEEIALAETVAEQVALTAENLRLMDETQRRAARQRTIGKITASVRETLDMETVLRTAVQEVRQALGLPEVRIRLATEGEHGLQDSDGL